MSIDRTPNGEWVVTHGNDSPARGRDLAETMGAAVGIAVQASLVPGSPEAWRRWIAEHAARIEAEAEA